MTANDIATVLTAVGDSWPAAIVVLAFVIGFVFWKALPYLKDIAHELHPNSGRSLRDAVDRIEAKTNEQATTLADHIEASEADRADLRARIEAVPQQTAEAVASE